MSEIEQIRQRDRNAIPRSGKPDKDPLLRAEMDRRLLLNALDAAAATTRELVDKIEKLEAERQRILGVVYALAPINVVQVVQEATR